MQSLHAGRLQGRQTSAWPDEAHRDRAISSWGAVWYSSLPSGPMSWWSTCVLH